VSVTGPSARDADRLGAEDLHHHVLQHEPDRDRRDQRRDVASPVAHRAKRDALDDNAEHGGREHGAGQGDPRREAGERQRQAHVGADHEDLAVGQVEQVQHAEDERVTDRDQGIGAAEHQPVDELLGEHCAR